MEKRWLRRKFAVGFALVAMFGLVGCPNKTGSGTTTPAARTVTVGAILPLTGPAASLGGLFRNGLQMGVDKVNEAKLVPGTTLQLVAEDGKGDPAASVSAFQKLRTQGVNVFVSTTSGVCVALAPVAEREQVLLFADATHPSLTGSGQFVVRHNFTAEQEAELLAQEALTKLSLKRLGILWINDEFGRTTEATFAGKLQPAGATVAASFSYEKTESDFRTPVTKLLAAKPDGVLVVGYGKALGTALKRLRELGFTGPLLTNIGLLVTPDALTTAGEAAKGVHHTAYNLDRTSAAYKEFETAYKAKFNKEPSEQEVLQYNEMLLLAELLKTTDGSPAAIAKALRAMKAFAGAGEHMTFTERGDVLPSLGVQEHRE